MTAEDVRSVTFEQVRKGYKPEDVDDFLLQVATDMQRLEAERNTAAAERATVAAEQNATITERDNAIASKEDAEAKMYVLAGKVEEYRGQEETLKTALINAQRMGETVVYEAKKKADTLLRDASGKAELLRQSAEDESEKERRVLENLKDEVKTFKTTILTMYKQHIESLSAWDPPVERAEETLEEYPARDQAMPSQVEEAISEAWSTQNSADLSIKIPRPPMDEFDAPQENLEAVPATMEPEFQPVYQPAQQESAHQEITAEAHYIQPVLPGQQNKPYQQPAQPIQPLKQPENPLPSYGAGTFGSNLN